MVNLSQTRLVAGIKQPVFVWSLFAASVLIAVVASPAPAAFARVFFAIVIGGGVVAAARLAGAKTQSIAAVSFLTLTLLQRCDARPVDRGPDSLWITALARPREIVQHVIAIPASPAGDAAWERAWQRADVAAAWVCARGPLHPEDGLQLWLNDELLGTITEAHSSAPRPLPDSVGFFRVPLTRSQIERRPAATFQLQRAPGASERPIDICGTFAYAPSAGMGASTLFDSTVWQDRGAEKRGRFLIELRLEDAAGSIFYTRY